MNQKNGLKRLGGFLNGAVNVLFYILMGCIFVATVILDKSVENPRPNTVPLPNAVYYVVALALLAVMFALLYLRKSRLSAKGFYIALAGVALATAVAQLFVARWMPSALEYFKSDFRQPVAAGMEIAKGGSLEGYTYFKTSPNNVNLAIALSFVFRVLPTYRAALYLGALLTNASMVLAALAVKNVTKKRGLALAVAVVGEVLVALTWRAFLIYTDNYGMIFVALMVWLYTTDFKPAVKVPLIILFGAIGCYIKITNLVVLAALFACGTVRWLRSPERRVNWKRAIAFTACFAVLFGGMLALQKPLRTHYGYKPGKYYKNWQYMFMVGQNTENLGEVGGGNGAVREKYIKKYKDQAKVSQALLNKAIKRIQRRGLWGNVVFYEKKINVAYNDGYFHNVQREPMYEMEHTLLYEIYFKVGKYYTIGASVMQVLWDMVLLTMMACAGFEIVNRVRRRKGLPAPAEDGADALARLAKIAILAITLYLMALEGRAKYLYMFMPIFLGAFGAMFHKVAAGLARREEE